MAASPLHRRRLKASQEARGREDKARLHQMLEEQTKASFLRSQRGNCLQEGSWGNAFNLARSPCSESVAVVFPPQCVKVSMEHALSGVRNSSREAAACVVYGHCATELGRPWAVQRILCRTTQDSSVSFKPMIDGALVPCTYTAVEIKLSVKCTI